MFPEQQGATCPAQLWPPRLGIKLLEGAPSTEKWRKGVYFRMASRKIGVISLVFALWVDRAQRGHINRTTPVERVLTQTTCSGRAIEVFPLRPRCMHDAAPVQRPGRGPRCETRVWSYTYRVWAVARVRALEPARATCAKETVRTSEDQGSGNKRRFLLLRDQIVPTYNITILQSVRIAPKLACYRRSQNSRAPLSSIYGAMLLCRSVCR